MNGEAKVLNEGPSTVEKRLSSSEMRWNTPKPLPVSDLEGEEETLTQEENDKQEEDFDLNQKDEDNTKEMSTQENGQPMKQQNQEVDDNMDTNLEVQK